jgi:hypothetical protein
LVNAGGEIAHLKPQRSRILEASIEFLESCRQPVALFLELFRRLRRRGEPLLYVFLGLGAPAFTERRPVNSPRS